MPLDQVDIEKAKFSENHLYSEIIVIKTLQILRKEIHLLQIDTLQADLG